MELTPKRADLTPVDTQFDTSTSALLGEFDRFDTYCEGDRFTLEEHARQHDADRRAHARGVVPIPYRKCQKCQIHQTASTWGCQIGVKLNPVGVKYTRKSGVKPPPQVFRTHRSTDLRLTANKTTPIRHT